MYLLRNVIFRLKLSIIVIISWLTTFSSASFTALVCDFSIPVLFLFLILVLFLVIIQVQVMDLVLVLVLVNGVSNQYFFLQAQAESQVNLYLSPSQAKHGTPTPFQAWVKLSLDIQLAFQPELNLAQILSLSSSQAEPGQFGNVSSGWIKL